MKILITGGFGYIGGRVAKALSESNNNQIVLASRGIKNVPDWLPTANVVRIEWNRVDSLNAATRGVDVVIHMAGMNAQDCEADPTAALKVNGLSTGRLLQSAIQQGVKRFIYLSTAHVYSSSLTGVITEASCAVNLHPYSTSHRAGEDAVRFSHSCNEIEGIVVRLSNSYGAPSNIDVNCWMLIVNNLCIQALTNEHMILQSSGKQRRDFISLTDVCRSIEHLINLSANKLGNGLFNIGGCWSPTILEMAQLLAERLYVINGKKIPIQSGSLGLQLPSYRLDYSIKKIANTDFKLTNNITDEIDGLIRFCIKHYV